MCSLSSKKKDITECLLAEYYASAKMHLYLDLIFLKEEGKVPASASIFTRFCIAVQGVPFQKCFPKLAKVIIFKFFWLFQPLVKMHNLVFFYGTPHSEEILRFFCQ